MSISTSALVQGIFGLRGRGTQGRDPEELREHGGFSLEATKENNAPLRVSLATKQLAVPESWRETAWLWRWGCGCGQAGTQEAHPGGMSGGAPLLPYA